jgi:hypothetical protein
MHLRPPSFSEGFASFLWAALFAVLIWLGLVAVDVSSGTAIVIAVTLGALIFFYVRLHGGDEFPDRR